MTPLDQNTKQPRVVVFGGSGFIGTHLCRRLTDAGERVLSIDILNPSMSIEGVEYRLGDVRDLSGLIIEGEISRIYNLAAVHTTPGHPVHQYYETNVLGALEVTTFARRSNVKEIIFTSSISVYGPSEDAKSELSDPAPMSAYGWSKFMAERAHRKWLEENDGNSLTICRPAVIFGRGEGGNFTRLAKLLKRGIFIYPGRKDTIKACFYVEDLLDAIEMARQEEDRFVLFNGCYPDRYTLEQIVETFRDKHMPKARTVMVPLLIVKIAVAMLRPVSAIGLGIHPERVMKLVRSTDIKPQWLQSRGLTKTDRLSRAIADWSATTNGAFD